MPLSRHGVRGERSISLSGFAQRNAQTGQKGSGLILSVQTFKKCPFYAGLFAMGKQRPSQILNVGDGVPMAAGAKGEAVSKLPLSRWCERHRFEVGCW